MFIFKKKTCAHYNVEFEASYPHQFSKMNQLHLLLFYAH